MLWDYIHILDLLGTFAFAISGALSAAEKRYDLFGIIFVASITAVGGGTTRDLLIGLTPVSWMQNYNYLIVIIAAVIFTFVFYKQILKWRKTLFLFDSIGLGVFTILGMQKALDTGVSLGFAVIMGVISAVLGGVIRDTFNNEVPLILRKEIYATACFIGAFLLIGLKYIGIGLEIAVPITIIMIIAIRIISLKYSLSLPSININQKHKK
jgi:uncharacterized membrane protein YeiH